MIVRASAAVLVCVGLGGAASGQDLYAITGGGDVHLLDVATGSPTFVGSSHAGANGAASDGSMIYIASGNTSLHVIDPATGSLVRTIALNNTGVVGYGVRGLAFDAAGTLYAVMSRVETNELDLLATIDLTAGAYTVIGETGATDLQGLSFDASGRLLAVGVLNSGRLYEIDTVTGVATELARGLLAGDDQALELCGGVLYAARQGLREIDPVLLTANPIGAIGLDIRGLACIEAGCYPDCDTSTGPGVLDIFDFLCFQDAFVAMDPYADCDGNTVFDIFDFICFQDAFTTGCP